MRQPRPGHTFPRGNHPAARRSPVRAAPKRANVPTGADARVLTLGVRGGGGGEEVVAAAAQRSAGESCEGRRAVAVAGARTGAKLH